MADSRQIQSKIPQGSPARPKLADPRTPAQGDSAPGKSKGKAGKKLFIMVMLVLVLAGGAFYGYRTWLHPDRPSVRGSQVASSGPQTTFSMQSITVNLADTDVSHFLKISIVLQYPAADSALGTEIKNKEYILDDSIISDLRTNTYDDLSTAQGEEALKKQLMGTINRILTEGRIDGIFFDQFLMQ